MSVKLAQKNGKGEMTTELSQEIIRDVSKALAVGHDRATCIEMVRSTHGGTIAKATAYVDSVIANVFHFDANWTAQVVAQTKLALNLTLQQIETMHDDAEDGRERVEALKLKLKALNQLRDLAPRQIEVQSLELQAEEVKRKLFDIHGIDADTIDAEDLY